MKYIIIIATTILVFAIILLRINYQRRMQAMELNYPTNDRTIDEIFSGRTYHDVFEELDSKEYNELTPNELEALMAIHLYWEHNSSNSSPNANV